jgi:hypothetical protein
MWMLGEVGTTRLACALVLCAAGCSDAAGGGASTDAGADDGADDAGSTNPGDDGADGSGPGGDGGTDTGPPPPPPPCGATIAEQVTVTAIDVTPALVKTQSGAAYSPHAPATMSVLPSGAAKVARTDTDDVTHVTSLRADGQPAGLELTTPGTEVRGFVARDDGGVLLVRGGAENDEMTLVRLHADGSTGFSTRVVGGVPHDQVGNKWISGDPHEAGMLWADDRYSVYLGHNQRWDDGIGHQGDLLWHYGANGDKQSGGWDWGCSHARDVRLAHNGTSLAALCLTDGYPIGGWGLALNDSADAIWRNDMVMGVVRFDLGGLAAVDGGFVVSFTTAVDRPSADVAMLHFTGDGTVGDLHWLTDNDVHEQSPWLARYGDHFFAAWNVEGSSSVVATIVDSGGNAVYEAEELQVEARPRDTFVTYPNGDVGWAWAWGDTSQLKIVRVANCE